MHHIDRHWPHILHLLLLFLLDLPYSGDAHVSLSKVHRAPRTDHHSEPTGCTIHPIMISRIRWLLPTLLVPVPMPIPMPVLVPMLIRMPPLDPSSCLLIRPISQCLPH